MRPLLFKAAIVVVVVVVGVGGFAGGWLAKPSSSSSSAQTLSVIAAGSLAPILPAFVTSFAATVPGVQAPTSAQLYEGSTDAASALAGGHQPYDVFLAADFRTIPSDLETPAPTVASWEVVFAADPVVLAYEPTVAALHGIDPTNWWTKIVQTGVILGVPNASSDPLGANAIFTLELQDAAANLSGSLYGHFFTGGEGALAKPTSATLYVSEDVAGTALSSGEVDTFLIYRSFAVADHLAYVNLSSGVNLGSTNSSSVSTYGSVSTTILSGTSTKVEKGAPVLFSLTVPTTATSVELGIEFAAYLLSNTTAATWSSYGFAPLVPQWSDAPSKVPAALSGSPSTGVTALPSYLAALL
jgi:tungstate ABC transporter binding protein WtpA